MTSAADVALYLKQWLEMLDDCHRKPSKKRVHALRVGTLRLQAQVQYWIQQHGPDHPFVPIVKKWNKQAKHLRRALGAVRDFDVHLDNLCLLRRLLTAESGYAPRSSRESLRQIDTLEARLKRDRRSATKELKETFESRRDKLHDTACKVAETPGLHQVAKFFTLQHVKAMFLEAASGFSRQNLQSLHDFRKSLKGLRYLAEIAPASAEMRQFAGSVKAMQGAIGDWHDWEELSLYTARVFRRKEDRELSEQLELIVAESLEKALVRCESAPDYLPMTQSPPSPAAGAAPAKKSAQSAEHAQSQLERISA